MPGLPVRLSSRALLSLTGPEAGDYLQRMITQTVEVAGDGTAGYGALLTPQGKVISDFLFVRVENGFLLDAPAAAAADLLKRLTMFRLRAQVELADISASMVVHAVLDGGATFGVGTLVRDPRHPDLGDRLYMTAEANAAEADEAAYHARRVALGIPELGFDAAPGDCFPHDLAMDELAGVSFTKGCFVGQEVVSRMKHRGTARRRPVRLVADDALPPQGTDILAAGRSLGPVGTVSGNAGLAILRLDKVKSAMEADEVVTVGDMPVRVDLPAWAHYGWPETVAGDD